MLLRLQGTRVLFSLFIVILSRASPQSDAQHDGRAAISNGAIMSWSPDAGSPSCSVSALTSLWSISTQKRPID